MENFNDLNLNDIDNDDNFSIDSIEYCDFIGCNKIGTDVIECCGNILCYKHYKKIINFCNTCKDECCKDCIILNNDELGFICSECKNYYCEVCVDDNKYCKCNE